MTDDVRKILLRARDLVEQGWCQGKYTREDAGRRCYCLGGAVRRAASESDAAVCSHDDALWAIARNIRAGSLIDIASWNDVSFRTQAEVVALLEAVAAEGGGT